MPVPARPHLIVVLSAAASSFDVRKFAPIGKSSSSLSPSANGPWQSAHPVLFHIAKPAFTVSLFCASVIVEYARAITARAFDEKVESLIVDSHDGANRIQDPHWCKGGQS